MQGIKEAVGFFYFHPPSLLLLLPVSIPNSNGTPSAFCLLPPPQTLPQGTNVIPLLSSVHSDPTQFKDPTSFNPENFLDENHSFKSNDAFMPFAPGMEERDASTFIRALLSTAGKRLGLQRPRWGVRFPTCAPLTEAGISEPLVPFQLCSSKALIKCSLRQSGCSG